ncbi:MAG: alpha/beta fold hydrolase [Erysipelotrichaceae bacterium]
MNKIFIHGLGQNSDSWSDVISKFTASDNCFCPNLKSLLGVKKVTFNNIYESFCHYCDTYNGKIDLCGISLGGMLALKYAIDNPQKVNSLVVLGAQYKIPKFLFLLQGLVFRCLPSSLFDDRGFTKKDFIALTESMINIDFSNGLSNITCETLVICGGKDYANLDASKKLHQLLKKSKLHLVTNCKHEVNVDSFEQLSEILLCFYNTSNI